MCKKIIILTITALCLLSFTSCGKEDSFVGEYEGVSVGWYLKLNSDGTCIYSEKEIAGCDKGEWELDDDKIIVRVDNIGYPICAEISKDDDGLMFKSESENWYDTYKEYFVKKK